MTFLSDYGLSDEFVAVCKAVIAAIAPATAVLDITHTIRPYAIREGAVILERAVAYMPSSVHLAVVDPGVGSKRKGIAVRTVEGSVLVGPDNGLLVPAARTLGGAEEVRELANPAFMLPKVSSTFHGRDIFAPVSAHLSNGIDIAELGPLLDPETLVELPPPAARNHDEHLHAEVLHVDAFGNLQLSVAATRLGDLGLKTGADIEVRFSYLWVVARFAETFASVSEGDWVLTEDSSGWLSLSIHRGNAALTMKAEAGDEVSIGPPGFTCSEEGAAVTGL